MSGLGVGVVSKLRAVWCDGWSGNRVMGEKKAEDCMGIGQGELLGVSSRQNLQGPSLADEDIGVRSGRQPGGQGGR